MLIQGYYDVSISRAGVRNDLVCGLNWGAYFKIDGDARALFPYINGAIKGARHHHRPHHVRFMHRSVQCTLYPSEAMLIPFRGNDLVIEYIEGLVVFLNDLYERRDQLTPDHSIDRQPSSIVDIVKALPRTNCKKCGHVTCMAFAAAMREGRATPDDCPDFAKPIAVYSVYPVFDKNGALESTFTIEKGYEPKQDPTEIGATKASLDRATPASTLSTATYPLYDRFGIKIQNDLTSRELEVLRLVADGASNPEISEMLHISPHTVKSHVIHIFNKLNVNDRTQAAVWATRNRLI